MVYVALVVGVLAGAGSLWLRRDSPSSRWWEHSNGIVDERFVFATLPGLSLLLLGVGVAALSGLAGPGVLVWLIAAVGIVLALAGLALSFLGFGRGALPDWLLPAWRRRGER